MTIYETIQDILKALRSGNIDYKSVIDSLTNAGMNRVDAEKMVDRLINQVIQEQVMKSYKKRMQEKHKVEKKYKPKYPISLDEYSFEDYSKLLAEINKKRSGSLVTVQRVFIIILVLGGLIACLLIMTGG